MFGILIVIISSLALGWLLGMFYLNDFSVRTGRLPRGKRILVIFPHPDDETNVAGTLWRLARRNCAVTLAVLTEGEYGTPDAHFDPTLGARRCKEMRAVAKLLGAKKLAQENFGDGQLAGKEKMLEKYLKTLLEAERPDIVISYDRAGLYGHQDHIACAEVLHKLLQHDFRHVEFWQSAWPKRLLAMSNLPEHMAKDPEFKAKRAAANMRIFTGRGVITRIRAVYAHSSQRLSFKDSTPYHLPPWLVHSWQIYEYYEKI